MTWRLAGWRWTGLLLVAATAAWVAWAWVPAGRATSDSAYYLDGARHLADGRGYRTSHVKMTSAQLQPIVDFGPGLSLLMAAGIQTGLDARRSAAVILAASYVLYAVAFYSLLLQVASGASWPLVLLLTGVLLVHPGVLLLLDTVGSDLPAAALWLCAVSLIVRLVRRTEPDRTSIAAAALCMSLALLIRWSMLYALVALCGAMLISLPRAWRLRLRFRATAVLLLLPLCALAPCLLRNYVTTRTWFGYRRIVLDNPLRVAAEALTGLGSGFWADLGGGFELARWIVTVLFLALLIFVFTSRRCWRYAPVRLMLVSSGGFVILLVLSASVSPIDTLSAPRYWLPVWPLLGAAALGSLTGLGGRDWASTAAASVFGAQLSLTGYGFAVDFLRELPEAHSGSGFFKESQAQSAPIRFLAQHGVADRTFFSNDPRVVLMYEGVGRIHDLPESARDLRPILDSGDVCILLFTETMTSRIEARLPAHRRVLETLHRQRLLRRVDADQAGEVWLSTKAE